MNALRLTCKTGDMQTYISSFLTITAAAALLFSCNERDEEHLITDVQPVAIDSVRVAQDTMNVFDIQFIRTYSTYAGNCEGFYGYDYLHTDVRNRQVVSYKYKTKANCTESTVLASQINFRPQYTGNFIFRFFNGKDAAGENQWIERKIHVR